MPHSSTNQPLVHLIPPSFKTFRRHFEHTYTRATDPASKISHPQIPHTHHSCQKGTTIPHSSIRALPTLDISGEQSTPFFIVNRHLHSLAPFHRLPLPIPSAHSSWTKSHPFVSHYSLF